MKFYGRVLLFIRQSVGQVVEAREQLLFADVVSGVSNFCSTICKGPKNRYRSRKTSINRVRLTTQDPLPF